MAAASIPLPARFAKHVFANASLRLQLFRDGLARITFYSAANLILLAGCAAIAYGCYQIYHPLGPIFGGWFGLRIARLWADKGLEK